ncbi:MAG: ATP-binding cassette domain-containing protein, partial [Bacteroidota bacterium]
MLEVQHLRLQFADKLLLEDISFQLAPAEILLLEGHSGSGKTSLLEALMGLQTAEVAGEIHFAER